MIACRDLLQKPSQNHAPDLSGGIETAIAAYETSDARSLPNISPGSAIKRFRVVATRIGTRVAPSADCAFGTRTPWSGRPAHEQHRSTSAMLISAEKTFRLINLLPLTSA